MAKEGAERAVPSNLSQRRRFLVFAPGVSKRRSLIPPSGALPHLERRLASPRAAPCLTWRIVLFAHGEDPCHLPLLAMSGDAARGEARRRSTEKYLALRLYDTQITRCGSCFGREQSHPYRSSRLNR
jgi:hypothetical protein